jgi:hypothetical protein
MPTVLGSRLRRALPVQTPSPSSRLARVVRLSTACSWQRSSVWLATVVVTLTSFLGCGGATTRIVPFAGLDAQRTIAACERLFPRGPFEATHVVEASIPFSDDASLIGVVAAEPNGQGFRSVLLTQEGIVIFDATRHGDQIAVERALPPIDPDGFGRNMTDDIRLALIHPDGRGVEVGQTSDGQSICRWSNGNEQTEVLLTGIREAKLTRLQNGSVVRRAWLKQIGDDGVAKEIQLETTSVIGYQLHLELQSFDRKSANAPATDPVVAPATDPVVVPATDSVVAPATDPVVAPATDPVVVPSQVQPSAASGT